MKKMITVALALVMVFALAISAAAKDSPTGKDYYTVVVSYEPSDGSLGTAVTDKNKVPTDGSEVVTLTASPTDGFFTLWIIEGEYDIVSGDRETPVLTIIPRSDIHAIANFRIDKTTLTMTASAVGDGTASVNPSKIAKGSNDTITFTAVDGNDTFTHWTLQCEYDIVEGSLTSRTLVIRPYTDVHGIATFVGSTGSSSTTTPSSRAASSGTSNTSGTSPKTGDPLFVIVGLAVLALGAGALAVKKIKE